MKPLVRNLLLLSMLAYAAPVQAIEPPATPTKVEIGLYLIDITAFDQREENFTVELDVVTRWRDPRRGFDPGEVGTEEQVYWEDQAREFLGAGWWAGLHIVNTVGQVGFGRMQTTVRSDGTVMNRARIEATLRAQLDFHGFPFDRQVLPIHVESYAYPARQLQLVVEESFTGFDQDFELPEWRVLRASENVEDRARVQEGREYSHLTATLEIERRSGYYLWKVILPLIVITMITWVVFWMSDDFLGRRAGISATGMLTVIAYQFVLADSLPRFPYLTAMDRIMLITLLFIAATMLENLVTSRMESEMRHRVDRASRFLFPAAYFAILAAVLIRVL